MAETISTAATEAIRISEAHMADASPEQQKALALEIVAAISLCISERTDEIRRDLERLVEDFQ